MSDEEYTPTTDEVRREWAERRADGYSLVLGDAADKVALAEFDRWLAAHDAEVRAVEREWAVSLAERHVLFLSDRRALVTAIRAQSEEANR